MGNFLSLSFWFDTRPEFITSAVQTVLIGGGLFFFVAAAVLMRLKTRKGPRRKIFRLFFLFCFYNLLINALWLLFTYEKAPLLSARFWFLLWAIGDAVWLYFIVKKIKKIKASQLLFAQEKEFRRYVP